MTWRAWLAAAAVLGLLDGVRAEGAFWISKDGPPAGFDLAEVSTQAEGKNDTLDYKLFITYGGKKISPWHDIPYSAGEHNGDRLLHFVCEIPKGTTAKMEINKENEYNPIIQDTKEGKLRYYKYNPEVGSTVNYGAIVQTWDHPGESYPDTGVGGDNDPIDVLQLNEQPCRPGEISAVRPLGVFALVDDGETDWKVLAVRADTPETAHMKDVDDVPAEKKSELIEWFRRYKTAEGKGLNRFGLDEKVMHKAYAYKVCDETHAYWRSLRYPMDPAAAVERLERPRLSEAAETATAAAATAAAAAAAATTTVVVFGHLWLTVFR